MKKKKENRSSKWAFLIYKESTPDNYLSVLEELHVPFVLSPWHDKDISMETGEIKKAHKHGALWFDSLKSYSQVSELISEKLNGPAHVEIVMSPKGMYNYFVHAENPDKSPYSVEEIESGCGFDLAKFLMEQEGGAFLNEVIDIVEENDFIEFEELVSYARKNNSMLLTLIVDKTYFFAKLLDSRRYNSEKQKTYFKLEQEER
ncbi:replication protein [Listeria monocytogenes]|uniref:Replication protein RepB n=1 Tax=Listeria monocytogenes TaxID=1639 RepID=A0A5Y9DI55_LISMN|nr:replication protein [Listeria monocytogenes]EAD2625005.1 Replication protein RepB [Listeria monocytogenes]EBF5145951.1 Replication protein RepB [Listeria monocytogenes]ECQ6721960.1 Replication protein RepB [Listeria monocytogenes]EDP7542958.1 Replication protein RepB [Listeria monocytogenes]EDP7814376.1 Replication protein RepB [Listeria monocytogenes]